MPYKLIISDMNTTFAVDLNTERRDLYEEEDFSRFIDVDEGHVIRTNRRYSFTVGPALNGVLSGSIFFNDVIPEADESTHTEAFRFSSDDCCFRIPRYIDGRYMPFSDLWGYVQIHVSLNMADGTRKDLFTDFLQVSNDDIALEKMASYVYTGTLPELLTQNGPLTSKLYAGILNDARDPLDTKISLIMKIVQVYDKHYDYFRENARVTTVQESKVDRLEKLKYATHDSIRYATQHPEELSQVPGGKGIRIGRAVYHPKHILMDQNVLSHDTYENRTILSFLSVVLDNLDELEESITGSKKPGKDHFVLFHEHLFSREYLDIRLSEIRMLRDHVTVLIRRYSQAFRLMPEKHFPLLRPTGIFRTVHPYREIYGYMMQWRSGVYDFESARFLLYCIGSSRLYESFVLSALIEYVISQGYQVEGRRFTYENAGPFYQNTPFNNTYECVKDGTTLTIYYQPVVYASGSGANGIELERSNTSDMRQIYTPDYIFKYRKPRTLNAQYIICDAKFSNLKTVKEHSLPDVIKKYSEGIKGTGSANISNRCVVYGKYMANDPDWISHGETEHRYGQEAVSHASIAKVIPLDYDLMRKNPRLFMRSLENMMTIGDFT